MHLILVLFDLTSPYQFYLVHLVNLITKYIILIKKLLIWSCKMKIIVIIIFVCHLELNLLRRHLGNPTKVTLMMMGWW